MLCATRSSLHVTSRLWRGGVIASWRRLKRILLLQKLPQQIRQLRQIEARAILAKGWLVVTCPGAKQRWRLARQVWLISYRLQT